MTPKTATKAVRVISQSIRYYENELSLEFEVMSELEFKNGNLNINTKESYTSLIELYTLILADLRTIRTAIINGKSSVKTYAVYRKDNELCSIISQILKKADFVAETDGIETLFFTPLEELDEMLSSNVRIPAPCVMYSSED